MKNVRTVLPLASLALVAGCYELMLASVSWSMPENWTGTARMSFNGAATTVGLAERDVVYFRGHNRGVRVESVAASMFSGDYALTSVAQTHSLGLHEHTFLHGNLVGRTDNLDLLHMSGTHYFGGGISRIQPRSLQIRSHGRDFRVVQICELAAASRSNYGSYTDPDSHLYLSIRACDTAGQCAGGVIEAEFAQGRWGIRPNQATLSKPDGSLFTNECMPLSVTTDISNVARHYVVVADPSADELSIFDAARLSAGPIESIHRPDGARIMVDVAVSATGYGPDSRTDLVFVAALWRASSGVMTIEHTFLSHGRNSDGAPFLSERVSSDVRFIESVLERVTDSGHLYTFGNTAVRRRYE